MQNVFPSISKTLAHIYITDAVWLSTMRESSFKQTRDMAKQLSSELEGKSLEETEVMFLGLTPEYTAFFAHQVDLDQPISLDHPYIGKLTTRFAELIQHVVNHGTYHRGNISSMLRQLGHRGIPTDYVYYLYEHANDEV